MKKLTIIMALAAIQMFCTALKAQDSPVNFKFGGFIKNDIYYDTRQTTSFREGHFYLYPKAKVPGPNSSDINAIPSLTMISIQSRLWTKVEGPEVMGAKTSGYMEAEYYGSAEVSINSLRLRHAFVDLDWANTQIRIGQYWHPTFVDECYADVLSFNTGTPFQGFSRNPQVRLTQKFGDFKAHLYFVSQRDFTSFGPNGQNNTYIRNAVMPELALRMQYNFDKDNLFGVIGEYKALKPGATAKRQVTDGGVQKTESFVSDENVNSYAGGAYLKLKYDNLHFKAYSLYGQNMCDVMSIGGYGISLNDTINGKLEYSPIGIATGWAEIMYKDDWEVGVMVAYQKNMGTDKNLVSSTIYGRDPNIDNLMRIEPWVGYTFKKFKVAFEVDYTSADYGTIDIKDKAKVNNTTKADNIRAIFGIWLFFN